MKRRRHGEAWDLILAEVTQFRLSTDGSGIPISMRISKDASLAVRVAKPGEEVVGTLLKQEVNVWDKFNMTRNDLAEKLQLSGPRTHALIYELGIQDDPECYRELSGSDRPSRGTALKRLIGFAKQRHRSIWTRLWQQQKHRFGAGARKGRLLSVVLPERIRDDVGTPATLSGSVGTPIALVTFVRLRRSRR